jgi:nucleotide-binding universal stress UspA family protein
MADTAEGILVGYDGSSDSEQAVRWAAREARARRAVLTVCQAWALGYPAPMTDVTAFDQARQFGEQILGRGERFARSIMGSLEVRTLLAPGTAAEVLCEQSAGADMVVVGSRGHGGLAGLLLGSVSSQVAAHAHGRVVVVRGHWRPAAGYVAGPVVVGADGSAASLPAVTFALEEAALREVPLLAVCALADCAGSFGEARRIEEEFGHAIAAAAKEHAGVAVKRQISHGSPRSALLAAAAEAQMLVVGSRGRGGVRGMMLGSVSQAMVHHATCPVGVVHPG